MTYVGVFGLAALVVVMTQTNPNQVEYEEYAAQRLTEYLNTNVCKKLQNF